MKQWWKGFVLIILVGLITSLVGPSALASDPNSPWFSANPPVLQKLSDIALVDIPQSMDGNRDCHQREVITRPARPSVGQAKQSHQSCVVDAGFGALSYSNYLQRPSTTTAGRIVASWGGSTTLLPTPRASTGIVVDGSANKGVYLHFIKNLDDKLSTSIVTAGQVTHRLPAEYDGSLKDKSGKLLAIDSSSISFSANGLWMMGSLPGIGSARINLETFEVLPFGDGVNYNLGITPGYRTAISPDGRYAVVASMTFETLKLYDLSTCDPVPAVITTKVPCQTNDLLPFIKHGIPGYRGIARMRFHGNNILDIYLATGPSNNVKHTHYTLSPSGHESTGFDYLALGDSFASGEGAYQYKAFTDTVLNKCHLSLRSYPYLLGSELGLSQYESVACSGALIYDVVNRNVLYEGQVKDGKTKRERNLVGIFSSWEPGYIAQFEFGHIKMPSLITVSAVGNDIGFGDKIKRCLDSDTCYSSYEDRLEIINEVNAQFDRLVAMYAELKQSSKPDARIYVLGYPQIADPDGNCAVNVRLNQSELAFANQLVSYLNQTIKAAADNQGVFYVNVEQAFTGYRLCEADSWDIAVNGMTVGNDIINLPLIHGPIGNESYHPNAWGHQLYKKAILEKTNGLTAPMPRPDSSVGTPDPTHAHALLQTPKTNRVVRIIKNVTGTNGGAIEIGKTWASRIFGISNIMKPGAVLEGWLNSSPVYLGSHVINQDGTVDIELTVDTSVQPGFHTLHLYGKNSSDELVDFYMTVYVTDAQITACGLVTAAGQDMDKDNLDDACDPLIASSPVPETFPSNQPDTTQNLSSPTENTPKTSDINQSEISPVRSNQPQDVQSSSIPPNPAPTTQAVLGTETMAIPSNPTNDSAPTKTEAKSQKPPHQEKSHPIKENFNLVLLSFLVAVLLGGITLRHICKK